MSSRSKLFFCVAGVLITAFVVYYATQAPSRRSLPWSATDVREHRVDLFVDYAYYLRARMPRDDFEAYARRLGLRAHTNEELIVNWEGRGLPDWWTATSSDRNAYWKRQGDHFVAAKYENGYAFVRAWSH